MTWLLAAMQLHLLLVLVLHHHVLPNVSLNLSTRTVTLGKPNQHSRPVSGEQGYCPACQILRHSAIRPSLGNLTLHWLAVAPLLAPSTAGTLPSAQSSSWYGRAPPLA